MLLPIHSTAHDPTSTITITRTVARHPQACPSSWMMAAVREGDDRQFGVVNVQPEYAQGGSGLEASRK